MNFKNSYEMDKWQLSLVGLTVEDIIQSQPNRAKTGKELAIMTVSQIAAMLIASAIVIGFVMLMGWW